MIPFRLSMVFAFITLITTFIGDRKYSIADLFQISECKKYTFFYLIMIFGIPFAYHRGEAFNYIFLVYLNNMLFFFFFLYHVNSFEKLKTIMFVICLCILFYSGLSLTSGAFSHGRFAYGTMYDPNDLAYLLVSLFPLCFYFVVNNEGFTKKIIAAVTIAVSIIVVLYTGSRGGFLGLITVFLLIFLTKTVPIKLLDKIVLLTSIAITLIFFSDKINTERFLTLIEIKDDYNVSDEFGRFQIWKRGVNLALSNPLTGVGVNCFPMAIGYAREDAEEIPKWQAAHNAYVQVLAETGLVGFAVFISIIIGCLRVLSNCQKSKSTFGESQEWRSIAGCIQIAFIGHLVTASFLTQGYSIFFTLFFAFSASIRNYFINQTDQ